MVEVFSCHFDKVVEAVLEQNFFDFIVQFLLISSESVFDLGGKSHLPSYIFLFTFGYKRDSGSSIRVNNVSTLNFALFVRVKSVTSLIGNLIFLHSSCIPLSHFLHTCCCVIKLKPLRFNSQHDRKMGCENNTFRGYCDCRIQFQQKDPIFLWACKIFRVL